MITSDTNAKNRDSLAYDEWLWTMASNSEVYLVNVSLLMCSVIRGFQHLVVTMPD